MHELAESKSVSRLLEIMLEKDDNPLLYFKRQTYFCVFHGMSAQPYTSTNLGSNNKKKRIIIKNKKQRTIIKNKKHHQFE